MNSRLMGLVLAALVGSASGWAATNDAPARSLTTAPAFLLPNLDGKTVKQADFKDKAVLMVFWTTWAAPCRDQLPALVELQRQYGGPNFTVLGISLDDKGAKVVKEFVAANKLNFPILMADYQVIQDFGGLTEIPTMFLVEKNRFIVQRYTGVIEKRTLETDLKAILPP